MAMTYPALAMVFGFGLPYTLFTRTPWRHNMWFVGVPPRDIYHYLLQGDASGNCAVDHKRSEVLSLLQDSTRLHDIVAERVSNGELDVEALLQTMSSQSALSTEDLRAEALRGLVATLREQLQNWADRLNTRDGIFCMCACTGTFKINHAALKARAWTAAVAPHDRAYARWPDLAEVLQGGRC